MGRTKGGLTSKRHMVSDGQGRPPTVFLSPGRRRVLLAEMPRAKRLLGEKGYKALAAGRAKGAKRPGLQSRPQPTKPPHQSHPNAHQDARPHREGLRAPDGLARPRQAHHPLRRPLPRRPRPRRRHPPDALVRLEARRAWACPGPAGSRHPREGAASSPGWGPPPPDRAITGPGSRM